MSTLLDERLTSRLRHGAGDQLLAPVKSFPVARFKALEGDAIQPGTFEAIVAVFNNVDAYGDRILPGAFTRTLKAPPEGRGFPPIVWSHMWMEPPIGASLEAEEVLGFELADGREIDGLRIVGLLNIDDNARARETWAAMAKLGGDGLSPLREFSFAYFVMESRWVEETIEGEPDDAEQKREILELIDLDVIEVGPTLLGANPATQLVDVRSGLPVPTSGGKLGRQLERAAAIAAEVKAGAVLSAANRQKIEGAVEALNEVLAAAEKPDDDGKSQTASEIDLEQRALVNELLTVPAPAFLSP